MMMKELMKTGEQTINIIEEEPAQQQQLNVEEIVPAKNVMEEPLQGQQEAPVQETKQIQKSVTEPAITEDETDIDNIFQEIMREDPEPTVQNQHDSSIVPGSTIRLRKRATSVEDS